MVHLGMRTGYTQRVDFGTNACASIASSHERFEQWIEGKEKLTAADNFCMKSIAVACSIAAPIIEHEKEFLMSKQSSSGAVVVPLPLRCMNLATAAVLP